MNRQNQFGLIFFSGACLIGALALFAFELVLYSNAFTVLPAGISLGGVPVGGLTEAAARQHLETAYSTPLELRYLEETVLLDPKVIGFQVNSAVMLPEATQYRTQQGFWNGFWDFIWLRVDQAHDVKLQSTYSPERLQTFLQDVAARYDQAGSPAQPDVGALGFKPGAEGRQLDIEGAIRAIEAKLISPTDRVVNLPIRSQNSLRPTIETLAELIIADVSLHDFREIFSLYLYNLDNGNELVINLSGGQAITGPIAFSGMSTIKIPIMVSFFARFDLPLTEEQTLLLQRSIDESANTATDFLLKTIGRGDGLDGAQEMNADMQRLGLKNTYISGLLDVLGAVSTPLQTPANSRLDITTEPDPFNQTTAEEMGSLMVMIYQCARGGGALMAAFPGKFTPEECRTMIDLLSSNLVGPIFVTGGTPSGVVAHKHGWDRDPLTNAADAALAFTPGGDYAITVFIHLQEGLAFPEANRMMISVARAIYNYFNPNEQ